MCAPNRLRLGWRHCETGGALAAVEIHRGDSLYDHYYADPANQPNPCCGAFVADQVWPTRFGRGRVTAPVIVFYAPSMHVARVHDVRITPARREAVVR